MRQHNLGNWFLRFQFAGNHAASRSCRRCCTHWSSTATLYPRVHVTLIVVEDKQEVMSTLNRTRQSLQTNIVSSAVTSQSDNIHMFIFHPAFLPHHLQRRLNPRSVRGSRLESRVQPWKSP